MRNFLLLLSVCSFILISITDCSTVPQSSGNKDTITGVKNRYFSDPEQEYFYRAQITAYGTDFSGMFILKKIAEDAHRIVMTGDFGNKMLDAEISESTFRINYILPNLDRTVIKNVLEKDFRILVKENYATTEKRTESAHDIYRSFHNKTYCDLYFERESGMLTQIIVNEKSKASSFFNYEAKNPIFAERIEILHQDIKLQIILSSINK